jgi:hypothetical protein
LAFAACNKGGDEAEDISNEDLQATQSMETELSLMSTALNNIQSAVTISDKQYWDSQFRLHDSVFWHHHNQYHHETYTHDDHGHQWVPYDPTVNHHGHHHPHYPGHQNDSLIVTTNNHHHINCDHHHGHHICHHHRISDLHHLHHQHHP